MAALPRMTPSAPRTAGFAPIGSYGVISDQRTAALVAADGSIDWMCAPRFDDPPLLGRLLDPDRGGVVELRPTAPFETERAYVEDSNILQTTWTTSTGVVRVTDALVISHQIQRFSQLVRRVECLSGSVDLRWVVRPRWGWDAITPQLRLRDVGHVLSHGDIEVLVQAFELGDVAADEGEVRAAVTLRAGDSGVLSVGFNHSFPLLAFDRAQCEQGLEDTGGFWRAWLRPLHYDGPWQAAVRRSVLALGACVHDQTGALVAAPTTSLPERIGGSRNYDYRYCWVRDTTFALDAALRLGMTQLAQATLGWLLRSQRHTHPRINVFFSLGGNPFCPEDHLDLPGYRGSRPVRSGNGAANQLQLGGYGDLMETAWLFVRSGSHLDQVSGLHIAEVADHVCETWGNEDSGIWEVSDERHYTHGKIGCWTALDRACRLARAGELQRADVARWQSVQAEIGAWIQQRCVSADGTLLRDGDGTGELDCSVLLAPRADYVDAADPGFARTIDRIRDELGAGGPLLYRYSGMRDEEGAFLACSFWMAEALTRAGRLDEAAEMLDELVGLGNDVGLLSEQIRPSDRELLGNMPQALSHLALLNAAAVHDEESSRRG